MQPQSALPKYTQISEMLIREMVAGRLLDGARLPPEREMAAELDIAVGTLRKALGELTRKGLLERRQGSGNYVRQGDLASAVYSFFRLELPQGGGLPTADVLSVERRKKPADLPDFGTCPEGHCIRRLRRLNGSPAALEEIWLDAGYAEKIVATDLSDSLYLFYNTALGLWITRAEDWVSLGKIPDWAPPAFGVTPGAISGLVERTSWAQDGQRAEVSRTWFDPARARYVARMK